MNIVQHSSIFINKKIANQISSFLEENINKKINVNIIGEISTAMELKEIRVVDGNIWITTQSTIELKKQESILNKIKKWLKI